ncbi:hypothetical protein HDK90DRAFT_469379 [Phyllosticta capitalensis]|uniref:F-box domain-containing protein n=1 Tax=Phyllosticta capitalensis TaxID=121624 RepID=A0ABR1YF85_9PEZI
MSSSDAASTLSVLEKLPTEVVGAIGSHLELAGLKTLRLTSKAMNNHLEFNLRELFKEIKCQTTLAEFEALARFQKQPLAKAVESLVWVKPGSNCCKLTIVEERRKIERDPDDRGPEEIETLKGSFFPPPEIPDLDLQRMIAKSVNEFPNLRAIGLAFKADPSIPGLCDLLEDEDLQYWAGTVCQIEKPLDVRAICTKFKYGICWTGSKETSRKQIIETSVPTDMIIADQDFWKAEFTTTFNILQEIRHELLGQDLRAVEFSRVAMDIRHFTYLFARAPLVEEVTVRESIITGLDGFIWEQKCDIPFMASPLDSLRGVRVVK